MRLSVEVRPEVKKRLARIAEREHQSVDYITDQILAWATDEYQGIGSLRMLVHGEVAITDEENDDLETLFK